ncbi:MAG: hypothetical protein APF84_17560 [Gracilibacter sp. BRH_c7a]|nr:MAG: hypothetical protein APF84_17560 [Gracilibacter sp. BRH_c7a]
MGQDRSVNISRSDIIKRLRRIEGQVKGLQRMLEGEKCCTDILIQVAAVRAAMNKVGILIFEEHSRACLERASKEDNNESMDSLIEVLNRFVK